jgi:hypothetical protein
MAFVFFCSFLLLIIVLVHERLQCVSREFFANKSQMKRRHLDFLFISIETMSQDSLHDDEQNDLKLILSPSSSSSSGTIHMLKLSSPGKSRECRNPPSLIFFLLLGHRTTDRDEHIRSVKHKKEATDVLRLRRFQEQLQKKEEKW